MAKHINVVEGPLCPSLNPALPVLLLMVYFRHRKSRVKAKSSLSGRNYFITMHHQAGVNFEYFTAVKFRDILLTGTGRWDRRLNRDSPGQTGTYGRSNFNQNLKPKPKSNFRLIHERPFAVPSFHQKCRNISHRMLHCSGVTMLNVARGRPYKCFLFPLLTFSYNK